MSEELDGSVGIVAQPALRGRTGILAVTAVVEEEHGEAGSGQRFGERRAVGTVARVAVEDEHRAPLAPALRLQQPSVELETVGGREAQLLRAREDGPRPRHGVIHG